MPTFASAIPVMPASDIKTIAHFYAEKVGFEILYQDDSYAALKRDHVHLHLWHAGDSDWKDRPDNRPIVSGAESFLAGTASCRIEVPEIDEFYAECLEAGIVHPNGPIKNQDFGQRDFSILDPDGNMTVFFKVLA